jgi:hypothetical protein
MSNPSSVTQSELDAAVGALRVAVGDAQELAWQPRPRPAPAELLPAEPPAPVVYVRPRPANLTEAMDRVQECNRELRRRAARAGRHMPPALSWKAVRVRLSDGSRREVAEVFTREGHRAWSEALRLWRDDGVDQMSLQLEAARGLTPGDVSILTILAASERGALTYREIVNESIRMERQDRTRMRRLSETTVEKRVAVLLAHRLVARPPGTQKKGVCITADGSRVLEFARGNPPETHGKK